MEPLDIHHSLKLDVSKNQVLNLKTKKVIKLEPRLVEILRYLANAEGKVVPRETLIRAIWENYNSGDQLLTHSISMLRKAIGGSVIQTVPKQGYLIKKQNDYNKKPKTRISYPQLIGYTALLLFVIKTLFFGHH